MIPCLHKDDLSTFYTYLDRSTTYFEYGSGGSTYHAYLRPNIRKIYSVESDRRWYNEVKNKVTDERLVYYLNDMECAPNNWGYPGPTCPTEQKIKYSSYLPNLSPEERNSIDLVMIDGRFRVACLLKCYGQVSEECVFLFDDFWNRPQYHIVLTYFESIDPYMNRQMAVLKQRKNMVVPKDIIKQYELVTN